MWHVAMAAANTQCVCQCNGAVPDTWKYDGNCKKRNVIIDDGGSAEGGVQIEKKVKESQIESGEYEEMR